MGYYMHRIIFAAICCSVFISGISQNPTQTVKSGQPVVKKPVTATAVQQKSTPAAKVLTPADIRKINTFGVIAYLIDFDMFQNDLNESWDVMPMSLWFAEYSPKSADSVVVSLKNKKGQTIHKISIFFDSDRVSRMKQYSLEKNDQSTDINNAKWKQILAYSYRLAYDSGRVAKIYRSYNGYEDVAHMINTYTFRYKNNALDQIVCTDYEAHLFGIAYYNGKERTDSVYVYGYSNFDKKSVLMETKRYDRSKTNEMRKESDDQDGRITSIKTKWMKSELIFLEKKVIDIRNGSYNGMLEIFAYDTARVPLSIKKYDIVSVPKESYTDTLIVKGDPYVSIFDYNENKQAVKETMTYRSKCVDIDDTISFTPDANGFIIQTRSNRNVITKCVY